MAGRHRKTQRTRRVQWLGQEPAENAIEVARQEIGPCYSRWAEDCITVSNDILREHGLSADCERLVQAMGAASDEAWDTFINDMPYCPGYFDYDAMRDGRGAETTTPTKKKSDNTALAVGAAVAVIGLALAALA